MYYKMSDYTLLGFERSRRKGKKYDAVIQKRDNEDIIKYIPFGALAYDNYQDRTGLNLYPIHGDEVRRANYKKRHKVYLRKGYFSPSFFSYYFLW
jgi:hypothetical protein